MRSHRGDFHFDDAALRDAAALIHHRGRRIYVTVNALLAAHELDRVFGRFQRGRRQDRMGGAGLGLAVALEIAKAHGGSIEVESAPGQGTTFTTWLPLIEKGSRD
jgi:light-regulated signal transduction histidine kinase (bacteriophytochrome)